MVWPHSWSWPCSRPSLQSSESASIGGGESGKGGMPPAGAFSSPPTVVDRGLAPPAGARWRALVRNTIAPGGIAILETYVDGYLTLPYTLPGAVDGAAAPVGDATLEAAFQLTLR